MTAISVVAGGWSFREVDHTKVPGRVIAVNDSVLHLTRSIDWVVGMDRLWVENRWATLEHRELPTYLRRATLKNIKDWQTKEWVRPFECDHTRPQFGSSVLQLNGRNSGACAVNLAYLCQPTQLFLFGFDMCLSPERKAHWYESYSWVAKGDKGGTSSGRYAEWASDFEYYAREFNKIGTEVFNVSKYSHITAFKRVSPEEVGCQR